MSVVVPAVQWAQTKSVVHVLVRFSPKKHGPVSVATVDEPDVALNATHLRFSATARPSVNSGKKPLRFELCIALDKPIDPAASTHSLASSGRLTLQLAKATTGGWERLAPRSSAPRSGAPSSRRGSRCRRRSTARAASPRRRARPASPSATTSRSRHEDAAAPLELSAPGGGDRSGGGVSAPLRKKLRPHWKRAVKRLKGWELDVTVLQLEIAALALADGAMLALRAVLLRKKTAAETRRLRASVGGEGGG